MLQTNDEEVISDMWSGEELHVDGWSVGSLIRRNSDVYVWLGFSGDHRWTMTAGKTASVRVYAMIDTAGIVH